MGWMKRKGGGRGEGEETDSHRRMRIRADVLLDALRE